MSPGPAWDRMVDRRGRPHGDARREALLAAFDDLLREQSLDEVNVADISRRAGVTRSAFYFYFENKPVAVTALAQGLYDAAAEANELLVGADGEPGERVRRAISGLFDSVDANPHTYRALLDARASSQLVRQMWDAGLAEYAEVIGTMISQERSAGRAPEGPDATVLAAVLLDLNNHALERHALGSGPPREEHVAALAHTWLLTIYGTVESTGVTS